MRLSFLLPLLVFCLGAAPARVSVPELGSLSTHLAHLRVTHGANGGRDAGPELTPVKHALREWIERQLPANPVGDLPDGSVHTLDSADLARLAMRMNRQLDAARLTCGVGGTTTDRCVTPADSDADLRGHIEPVQLSLLDNGRYVLVVTGVGVTCGYDESAYIYEHRADRRWHLVLASEQNDYAEGIYAPQNFISIAVSPSEVGWNEPAPPPLVTTLGFSPWCRSNWQTLYTRLWRASPETPTPAPLLDRHDGFFMGGDMIAGARLTTRDLLVQYDAGSIDTDVFTRARILHYRIAAGGKLERIAPVALDPRSFVEEWMTSDWLQARVWNEPSADDAALARLHPPAPAPDEILSGSFDDSLRRCRTDPSLWQVAVTLEASKTVPNPVPIYFHIRWMPPYRFTLVEAGHSPFAGCDEKMVAPDDVGTLFPLQGWRADQP